MSKIGRKEPSLGAPRPSSELNDAPRIGSPSHLEQIENDDWKIEKPISEPSNFTPVENIETTILSQIHSRKEEMSNIQPLGEVANEKIERLFGQQAQAPKKLGPAPSKMRYKMERLWLTPVVRSIARTGLPMLFLMGLGLWALSQDALRESFTEKLVEARDSLDTRPEFQIELLKITGVDDQTAETIRSTLDLHFPVSSFELELGTLREQIEALDHVKEAKLNLIEGKLLEVEITKRRAVLLWRKGRELELLDENGVRAGVVESRLDRRDLPLIAGIGAEESIDEALSIFQAATPIKARLRGLRRMGERRWDVVLDRGQMIQLPEEAPITALQRVIALQATQNLLDKDIRAIDMRVPSRPIIRMSEVSAELIRAGILEELRQ